MTPRSLQAEIQQGRPFRSPGHEGVVALLRTTAVVRRSLARVVEGAGITLAQYNVLRILRGAGPEGLPTLAIRDRLIEEAPGITRLLDKLERAGLVRRDRCTPDRRQVICRITDRGLAMLAELDAPVDAVDDQAFAALEPEALRELVRLLERVRAAHGGAG